jgi:ubiquinone/menaquinone biosynthesis C-methylase UbiE
MARKGIRVTGIDLGDFPIEQAIEQARETGIEGEWIRGNFFEHEFGNRFDWIALLGTQLQEFPPEELDAMFGKTASLLKDGGKLICCAQRFEPSEREYSSYWYLPELCLYTDKKALVLGENFYDPEERIRVLREYALEMPTGRVLAGGRTEKEYTPEELGQASAARGLKMTAAYGGFDRSEWTPESPRLIAVFERIR